MSTVRLLAPAKLTLSLRITGVRSDGYHMIDGEMVTLDLFDILDVDTEGTGVSLSDDSDIEHASAIDLADNLVSRALSLAEVEAGVVVTKRIPAGAGLGGGSADAAAILRWAAFTDVAAAATIGADVAFCLVGGRARVTGIGEVVEPLPFVDRAFTIVTPPVHCSTPEVYAMWDHLGGPTSAGSNDLEAAAIAVVPELTEARDRLGDATGETPRLAGSGSSWFVDGEHPGAGLVVRAYNPNAHSAGRGPGPLA